jgi:hypothetical protein
VGPTCTAAAIAARALAVLGLLLLASCAKEREPVAQACFGEPAAVLSTLRQGPPVVLEDGTRLSSCVSGARTDGDLQSLGLLFVRVADLLRAQAASDLEAAFAMGYLAGAVMRGARSSSGSIAAQLARRVHQVATLEAGAGADALSALARGRRAGERDG